MRHQLPEDPPDLTPRQDRLVSLVLIMFSLSVFVLLAVAIALHGI